MSANINLKSLIIYEDDDLLVLNKPAGLIVNSATSHQEVSLQNLMTDYLHLTSLAPAFNSQLIPADFDPQYGSPAQIWQDRLGMVHRLDKNTSGLILWAKNPASLILLLRSFRQREISKTYLCLVHGLFGQETSGRISLPLARKLTNRQIMAVNPAGRAAVTNYQVLQTWREFSYSRLQTVLPDIPFNRQHFAKVYQGFSLVQAAPKTGRTHQIRAHFTHLKHPLAGDIAYLSHKKAQLDALWCPRQFLHASEITFPHPTTHQLQTFSVPLPVDLQTVLTFLQ